MPRHMLPDDEFYQSLPKKRMAAGCLFFDAHGWILLVKPTYKPTWEIPGGVVVEPDGGMRHPFHDAEEMVERLASLEAVRTRGEKEKERHSSDR